MAAPIRKELGSFMMNPLRESAQHRPAFSDTFERVDFARRRIAELLRGSQTIPDHAAVADSLAATASHCWCLWAAPRPARPALLVSGGWNLSAFVLQGLFSRVDLWETDAHRAAVMESVAAEGGMNVRVHHCPVVELPERLKAVDEPYGLAAMHGAFSLIPRRSRTARRAVLHRLAAATAADGQCCIVDRNRFALATVSDWFRADNAAPTVAELHEGWAVSGKGPLETLFLHPDHRDPTEVLFPPEVLPRARRDQALPRILRRWGVIERILGSFASFLPLTRGSLLIDRAGEAWQQGRSASAGFGDVRDCSIRGNAMMFVTMALADGGEVIVRVPLLREAADALARLDAVYADAACTMPDVHRLIPESRPLFSIHGWPVHVERKCAGVPIRALTGDSGSRTKIRTQILAFVNGLCGATLEKHVVDDGFAEAHYRSRVRSICAVESALAQDLLSVESMAIERALGQVMPTVRIHGDLTVNNVFADPASMALNGVIDWETSLPGSLPFDFIHYLISERREQDPQPWGALVARALAGDLLDPEAEALLNDHFRFLGLGEEQVVPLLVGYWVRGVALRQALSGGRLAPAWREQNLTGPLASIRQTLLDRR